MAFIKKVVIQVLTELFGNPKISHMTLLSINFSAYNTGIRH